MYNVKLDNTRHYVTHATIGGCGGINISTLPPDMNKAIFYIYDYMDIPIIEKVPIVDEYGNETGQYIDQQVTTTVLDWYLDEDKYNNYLLEELSTIKKNKISELGKICSSNILNGTNVQTTVGEEHFSFKDDDQKNIKNAYDIAKITNIEVIYHADETPCRLFTVSEITNIYVTMQNHIAYNTTLCNMLNTWVRRCSSKEEIDSIQYTSQLPEDLQILFDQNLAQAKLISDALLSK